MKITSDPPSSSMMSISDSGGTSTDEVKPDDDSDRTWRLDRCERCLVAGVLASLVVAATGLAVRPFCGALGVSTDVVLYMVSGGVICFAVFNGVLINYLQWKHVSEQLRQTQKTTSAPVSELV